MKKSQRKIRFVNCEQSGDNFTAILRFGSSRAEQDELRSTLKNYAKNAMQNEIVIICGTVILKKIVDEICKSKYFTILAEEITEIIDVNKVKQFPSCIRYVDTE